MGCKGVCGKYKRTRRVGNSNYTDGVKRCNHCGIFLDWTGIHCPCCGFKLRIKPRNKYYKERFSAGRY